MDNKTSKQIIKEALNISISKGCFGLIEVSNIVKAIEFIEQVKAARKEKKKEPIKVEPRVTKQRK